MSEECSDYIDCRQILRKLMEKPAIKVYITRHALNRAFERCAGRVKKLDKTTALDVVRNVIRDGLYKAYTQTIFVWTSSYLLACTVNKSLDIVVKTIMTRGDLTDKVKAKLKKGVKARWSKIIVEA